MNTPACPRVFIPCFWVPARRHDPLLSLLTGFGGEASYVDALLSVYSPREDPTLLSRLRDIRKTVARR